MAIRAPQPDSAPRQPTDDVNDPYFWEYFERATDYVEAHRAELLKQYPDTWIFVAPEGVIDSGKSFTAIVKRLVRRGYKPHLMYREHMRTNQADWAY